MKAEDFYWKNKPKNSYDSGGRISMTESELWELMNCYATIQVDNENTVKLREECRNCHKDMKFLGVAYECDCGVVKLQKTLE